MARLPRVVIPCIPHHVTRRDNGRQQTFFEEGDYALYLDPLAGAAERARAEVWAYCLIDVTPTFIRLRLESRHRLTVPRFCVRVQC